jgi:hypothetical protein
VTVLSPEQWRARERAHAERVDAATAGHRARRTDGTKHPVEDFLFTYYANSVTALRRWHPGAGVELAAASSTERAAWRYYRAGDDVVAVDLDAYLADRGPRLGAVRRLLAATLDRPAAFGCFGLHEWAMLYRPGAGEVRHEQLPLRLGQAGTDAVVESHRVQCSHVDAHRFFTRAGVPRNTLTPTRETQQQLEQPGCLHATMDLYKWAYKLSPAVPGELLADCFELAADVRELDMRASPYDLGALGWAPVAIETPEGKAEYVAAQRGFAARGAVLRARLLDVCRQLLDDRAPGAVVS